MAAVRPGVTATPKTIGTCQACNLKFNTVEEMREHYATEFHAANVKARIEGQAKLTAAEFRRKTATDEEKKPVFNCKLCKKQFHSVQTLQSHVKSTEHLMRKEQRIIERDSNAGSALSSTSLGSAALGLHRRHRAHLRARIKAKEALNAGAAVDDVPDVITAEDAAVLKAKRKLQLAAAAAGASPKAKVSFDDREADVTEARCLFCGLPCKTMKRNLAHMLEVHEFSIPLAERVPDMRALLQYLARKINGLVCLVCGDSTKRYESMEALRAHMTSVGHERLVLSSEYQQYYEGKIDDGEAAEFPTIENGSAALVLRGDKRIRVVKKEANTGLVRRIAENPIQQEQRRLITATGAAESQLMLKEYRQETQKERTKHFKIMNVHYRAMKKNQLRCGIKKLWTKGYDGEGEMA